MNAATTLLKKIAGSLPLMQLFVLFFVSQGVSSQELVVNPGFDGGSSAGWSTSCTIEIYPVSVYGGSGSNSVTEIDVERCINQNVCVFAGSSYNFGFKASRRIDAITAASVGITVKVTGMQTGTDYVNSNLVFTNTTFNLAAQSFNFSIPSGSADRKVNIQFLNYNNTATYGVLVDDIYLSPVDTLKLVGPDVATVNVGSAFSVLNAPASGVNYNWNFASNSTPGTSTASAPSNIIWSAAGNKLVTVGLDNGTCTIASLNKTVAVTSILPVRVVSFNGELRKGKAELAWTADNEEHDGKYFVIERATAQNGFDSIGRIPVSSFSTLAKYEYQDNAPVAGTNQYRLKMVDHKNGVTFSKIININNAQGTAMQVYPNPAVSSLSFKLNSDRVKEAVIQVYSLTGRMALSKKQHLAAGINEHSVDISSLQPGSYFLRIASADEVNFVQSFAKK